MSAAMNRADTSIQSTGTHPDLSLGSLVSGFSTPARNLRVPSTSTATSSALISTPSPPTAAQFTRRRLDDPTPRRRGTGLEDIDDGDGDILDTPGQEKNWAEGYDSTSASRAKRAKGVAKGGVNLTLRDQEKVSEGHLVVASTQASYLVARPSLYIWLSRRPPLFRCHGSTLLPLI